MVDPTIGAEGVEGKPSSQREEWLGMWPGAYMLRLKCLLEMCLVPCQPHSDFWEKLGISKNETKE